MSRKTLGYVLLGIGLVLVAVSLLVMFVVVPSMKQLPGDVDIVRTYEGEMPVVLVVHEDGTPEVLSGLEVVIERHVKTEDTDGRLALVSENQKLFGKGDPNAEDEGRRENFLIREITKYYALDRKTMEFSPDYPEAWKDRIDMERGGLIIGWPIDTEEKDYPGWSDDYEHTVTLKFEKKEEHPRAKIDTYLFTSSGSEPITRGGATLLGLPMSLDRTKLITAIGAASDATAPADMTDEEKLARNQRKIKVAGLASKLPETVSLDYNYSYEGWYWVEPQTGVLIDTKKHEVRTVKLAEDMIVALGDALIAQLPQEAQTAMAADEQAITALREEMRTGQLSEETRAALLEYMSEDDLTKWEANLEPMQILATLEVPVYDLTYQADDKSVQDAKADAEDAKNAINLYGTTLPIIGNIAGIVLILIGAFVAMRRAA